MRKKGVSPVISAVLLISIVVVLSAIIFLWARGFITESVMKFDAPIEQSCPDVDFLASVSGDELDLSNNGNIPIYAINLKYVSLGSSQIKVHITEMGAGEAQTIDIAGDDVSGYNSIKVIPVLVGRSDDGKKISVPCDDVYGVIAEVI